MKAKTLVELMTLSTNLYMISKDEEFMKNLSEITQKGKAKLDDFIGDIAGEGEENEEKLIQRVLHKAQQAKEEIEQKMEEVAAKVYQKIHIAHTDEVKKLQEEIELLKKELALISARIGSLEPKKA